MNRLIPIAIYLLLFFYGQTEAQTTINLKDDWRFNPDLKNVGIAEKWFASDYDDENWVLLEAGKRWEEQGYAGLDSYAWYRKSVEVPAEWQGKQIWLVLGGINDAYVLFCNGGAVLKNPFKTERDFTCTCSIGLLVKNLVFMVS